MFQWKVRLAAVSIVAAVVASGGGFFASADWLHWSW